MRKAVLGIVALGACVWGTSSAMAEDLEVLDPQIAQAFAQALTEAAGKIEKPQVKIDADVEKACGVHLDQVGLIIVPQKDITPENDAVNSDPALPWRTCSCRPVSLRSSTTSRWTPPSSAR